MSIYKFISMSVLPFLDVVHYKTLNTSFDILLLVINPPKPTRGLDALSKFFGFSLYSHIPSSSHTQGVQ
jgi:hypothetical protein